MLRLILPPNLAAAAPRDAIAVRIELELTGPVPPGLAPALAILQRLGVPARPVSLVQLKRAQLRELLQALVGERVFFRADRPAEPLAWNGLDLPGVSEHLPESPPKHGALGTSTGPAAAGNGAPGPVLDYAMPSHKKSWLPSPALIKNLGCLFKLLFGFVVLIVLGYCALVALNPKARKWATQGAKDGSGGPTPFKIMNQVLAIPAQAIGKTKDVVAASDARTGMLDGVIADEEAKKKKAGATAAAPVPPVVDPFAPPDAAAKPGVSAARAAGAASVSGDAAAANPGVSSSALLAMAEKPDDAAETGDQAPTPINTTPRDPPAPPEMKLAGGIIVSSASPAGGPVVHASFFYWVVNVNISGAFQSPPHRVMLDKRLVYEGQEVNAALGITFDHLDLANKLIVFRDKSGALVTRSY